MSIVTVENLHRYFDDVKAVRGVSFNIEAGQVVGFIGANGAGKTTTMRIMSSLDLPTAGDVKIGKYSVIHNRAVIRDRLGWMPDAYGSYYDMTVWEYLDFYARAFGFVGQERKERLDEVIDFTGLSPLLDREIDSLSKGMRQRLCLGRMLIPDPDILVMDEPAAGLDPRARVEFKHLIRLLAGENKAIFISSHILTELEDMCDMILFIDNGKIVHYGSAQELRSNNGAGQFCLDIRVSEQVEKLEEWISMRPGVEVHEGLKDGFRVRLESSEKEFVQKLLKQLVLDDIPVVEFRQVQRRLEDAFIDLLEGVESGEKSR